MDKPVTTIAQADEVLCNVVFPVAVNVVQIDGSVFIGQPAEHAAPTITLPGFEATYAIVLPDAKLFFRRHGRAWTHRMHNPAAILPGALFACCSVLRAMTPRRVFPWLVTVYAQSATQMIRNASLHLVALLSRTLRTFRFAKFSRMWAGTTLPAIGLENDADGVVMDTKDAGGFADFLGLSKHSQDTVSVNSSWSRHSLLVSLFVALTKRNGTSSMARLQHISYTLGKKKSYVYVRDMGNNLVTLISPIFGTTYRQNNVLGIAVNQKGTPPWRNLVYTTFT